ncbi:MAG: DUF1553 domain-containing protein [Planctomycetaceae bacterium]|nr:DUF1553 domain-containing protein [Planctomycetaceae bacterium]
MMRSCNSTRWASCLAFQPWAWGLIVGFSASLAAAATPRGSETIEFNRDIRPILSANCFACHGFDAKARQAELRLDTPDGAFVDREGMAAIKPGDPSASVIWKRIVSTDPDEVMPPATSNHVLTDDEKSLLKRWIEQGAPYQKHWAFEAPSAGEVPSVRDGSWVRTPIDAFLLARLEEEGLEPNREADRPTLVRRVAFALTGLPPTREEVDAFLSDTSPRAYEAMVERYLVSPRHGEEMARHWLDVARYADTHGLHLDNEREMWAYRDWVIGAFNRNLPFDQFTVEQLAGDLLPSPTKDQLIATGFNRCNVTTSEGGSIAEEFLYRYAVERTSTTIETWLGLTGGCAVCHDHKYDPLSTKEFYSLYAFFYSAADPAMDGNIRDTTPFLSLATPEQEAELARRQAQRDAAKKARDEFVAKYEYVDPAVPYGLEGPVSALAAIPVPTQHTLIDDLVPRGATIRARTRNAVTWTPADELPCPSGRRSLKQSAADVYYDRFTNPHVPWMMPVDGKISVWVRLDPAGPPRAIMLDFATTSGARRAIWGDAQAVGSGEVGTPGRFRVGDLPTPGEWTRLTVAASDLNWPKGGEATQLDLVEVDGTVWWDQLVFEGKQAPQDDPYASMDAWWASRKGKNTPAAPKVAQTFLNIGPSPDLPAEQRGEIQKYFVNEIAKPDDSQWETHEQAWLDAEAHWRTLADNIPGTFVFKDESTPREAHVMLRGQYDKPGEAVTANVPAILPPLATTDGNQPSRLDLARWLVSDNQPLTARVAANRIWQQFFGTGLVETSSDFGSQGSPPSHPELLDWLAVWYREHNWDTRELVRMIVLSAVFRQDATVRPDVLERDPKNRLLARGPRLRLDAEQIRDNSLFVSGLIDLEMGGPGVKLYQPPNIWEPVGYADSNTRYYLQDHGSSLYRRSIYAFLKRTAPPPFMTNFDGPNREQSCTRRERTNTPLQALQLMNDVQHVEAARGLAARILRDGGADDEARLTFAWQVVLVRAPEPRELAAVRSALGEFRSRYAASPEAAAKLIAVGESPVPQDLPASELAAYTLVANLLLNLDETVTRN